MSAMKALAGLALALLLAGCGFQLRGQAELPFDTLHIDGPAGSQVTTQLRRYVRSGSNVRLVDEPKEAKATLQVLSEHREKQILSLSTAGRVSEYALNYRVSFRVYDKTGNLIEPTTVSLRRAISFSDSQAIQRESEELLLYRDMQNDAVQQIMRRLEAVRPAA
jgi:LPS-assembly lipoprotein